MRRSTCIKQYAENKCTQKHCITTNDHKHNAAWRFQLQRTDIVKQSYCFL